MLAKGFAKKGQNCYCYSDPVNYTDPTGEIRNILGVSDCPSGCRRRL